ncbi:glycosyltransferase family 39 protein [Methanobrevibacter filiformis]|uniref:Glycosyltransferase RgtA/B/C/D-like domain-containing protein n=1 Tax=Methanobrevibacter filiformis TaxID=55758 RepID=A0A166E2Q4_9EURY|nr:glycosyltransferase family 39 protein [Methanobrevibacter filiformis]KZX16214.1 hypothetical protein MBFIL_05440 [Methanobrevibacter filiformis]
MDFQSIKTKGNLLSIIAIFLFGVTITTLTIIKNNNLWSIGYNFHDTYLYLDYALRLSGVYIGGYEFIDTLSPLIPFLTSIAFRLGFVSEITLFIITGSFCVVGVVGLYLLFKLYFKNLIAILGSVICFSLSINLIWLSTGTIDIASTALSIWAIYLTFLGVQKNQKYLYLGFSVLVLGFFAKFTAALVFPVMIFIIFNSYLNNGSFKKHVKKTVIGIIAGIITVIPYGAYLINYNIPIGFINQANEIATKSTAMPPINNIYYYFQSLPIIIGNYSINFNNFHIEIFLELLILGIIITGIIIGIIMFIKFLKNYWNQPDLLFNKIAIKINTKQAIAIMIGNIIVTGLFFFIVGEISVIFSEIVFFLNIFLFTFLLNKLLINNGIKTKRINYILTMFMWFFTYILFFSAHLVKGTRYFIVMTPPFAFFIILSLESINNRISLEKRKNKQNMDKKSYFNFKNSAAVILIAIFLVFSISTTSSFGYKSSTDLYHAENVIEASNWLKTYDIDYKNKTIYSDRGEMLTWLLKKEVIAIGYNSMKNPKIKDNITERMLNNDTSYYIGENGLHLNGFAKLKSFGTVTIYINNKKQYKNNKNNK